MTTQQLDELILAMLVIFILGFFIGNRELKKRWDEYYSRLRDRVWELEIAQMRLALETRRLKLQETEQNIKEKSNVA
jgi:hypothetical protein